MITRAQSATLAKLSSELNAAEAAVVAAQALLGDVTGRIMNEVRAIVATRSHVITREHGTPRGYTQHIRLHEPTCAPCRQAETRHRASTRAAYRAAKKEEQMTRRTP